MFLEMNNALADLPNEMVCALAGQRNPQCVNVPTSRNEMRHSLPSQVGAAISCFISATKRNFGRTA